MKEMWDQRFSSEEYVYGTEPNLFFKEKLEVLHPGKLLLPAEGEGRNAVFAAQQGWQVIAVDYSEQARIKALKLAGMNNVQIDYIVSDMTNMYFDKEVFDAAALVCFHLMPELRKIVHAKIISSLKPGGYIILEAFNTKQIKNSSGGPKSVEMLYSIPVLKNDFHELDILSLEETTSNLDQGDFHNGEAEIIRLFGRKTQKKL